MNDQDTGGAGDASSVQDDRPNMQDRPPVIAFDPHFGSRSGGDRRDTSDFDEMMWERVA